MKEVRSLADREGDREEEDLEDRAEEDNPIYQSTNAVRSHISCCIFYFCMGFLMFFTNFMLQEKKILYICIVVCNTTRISVMKTKREF